LGKKFTTPISKAPGAKAPESLDTVKTKGTLAIGYCISFGSLINKLEL
jgi:hypothetical protein